MVTFRPSKGLEERYQRVVEEMRGAALEHRRVRPMEDVVFLVVPSTAVRVMKTFGIGEFLVGVFFGFGLFLLVGKGQGGSMVRCSC